MLYSEVAGFNLVWVHGYYHAVTDTAYNLPYLIPWMEKVVF